MQQHRAGVVSYVRRPFSFRVTPTENEQPYSITYPSSYADSCMESTKSLGLKSLSSSPINNMKPSNKDIVNTRAKYSKLVIIAIIVGIIIGMTALAAMGISIYSLVRLTTSATAASTSYKNTSISLRWMTKGLTVAGIGDVASVSSDRFNIPYGIDLDSSNTIYVADYINNRVQKWTVDAIQGTTVAGQAIGTGGPGSNVLTSPTGVTVDENGNIYVADTGNNRVQFWANGASSGTTIAGTGSSGSGNNQLSLPTGLSRDSNTGTLYIADSNNDRIMKYTLGATTGTVVAGGNGRGISNTQLAYPIGLCFDAFSNSIFIANLYSQTVVRWVLGANSWTLVAGNLNNVTGSTPTLLSIPIGITLDPMGNLYVADTGNHRIQLFLAGQSSGKTIAGVATTCGKVSSLLCFPYWTTLDNQLNLYVVDTVNNRIQKFLRY